MGILVSLFAAMLLTALGMSLVLLGSAETTLAAHDAQAQAAMHAAVGAIAITGAACASRLVTVQIVMPPSADGATGGKCRTSGPASHPRSSPAPAARRSAPSACSASRARCCRSAVSGWFRARRWAAVASDSTVPLSAAVNAVATIVSTRLMPGPLPAW